MFKMVKQKFSAAQLAALSAMLVASASAHAELPAGVAAAVTQIGDDGQAVFDLVIPIVLSFLGLAVVVKLIKRFVMKV